MTLIGIVSFFLAIVSIILSLYSLSNKNNCKNLCIIDVVSKRKNYNYLVLYNSSDFYITKNDVYQELHIVRSRKNNKVFNCTVFFQLENSNVKTEREDDKFMIHFDHIAPRHFAIIRIKKHGKRRVDLKVILDNCRIIRRKFSRYKFLYHGMTSYIISVLCGVSLFLLFVASFLIDEDTIGNNFSLLAQTCFFLTIIIAYPAINLCKKFLFLDEKAYKSIRKKIADSEKEFQQSLKSATNSHAD